jgi:hypothetical protein
MFLLKKSVPSETVLSAEGFKAMVQTVWSFGPLAAKYWEEGMVIAMGFP